jgi:alpha-ketoglutarate-dependent taurine dioxygenase
MHVESDSDWAPADTKSGTIEETAQLFDCHVQYKMEEGDLLLFNNRAWTHAVNNWNPDDERKLRAMYA